jgi:SAM-dependent methyltransferase
MHIQHPDSRLDSLWGMIDRQHNEEIIRRIRGRRVLDVGCGYGSLVALLTRRHFDAHGVDPDPESIAAAKQRFPYTDVRLARAEDLDSSFDGTFDAVTLKDCLHHLIGEGEADSAFDAFRRLLRPGGRLVVLDPNPIWILRLARWLARFQDFQTPLEEAQDTLARHGFRIRSVSYYEVIGLPLSGGYVFVELLPRVRALQVAVAVINGVLSRLADGLQLGKFICWRYILVAEYSGLRDHHP